MGLKSAGALKEFCAELAEDLPSPGGGSAAAAAGAMAASLLAMVCGITAKSKKHADKADTMSGLRNELLTLQGRLLEHARLDAEAYDMVVTKSRRRREAPGSESDEEYDSALKGAAEVPLATAEACAEVLRIAITVAELGTRNAHSDVGTALLLAEAGLGGADMNVRINLDMIRDEGYRRTASKRIDELSILGRSTLSEARARLASKTTG